MPTEQISEPFNSFLSEIDACIIEPVELHCLGGFVITSFYDLPRHTADVDVIAIAPAIYRKSLLEIAGKGSELHRKHKVYIDFVTVMNLPENYDDRVRKMFPGKFEKLRLWALDPYDLALSKLERNIERDRRDVRHLARHIPLDLDILKDRYETELKAIVFNPDREGNTLRLWIDMIKEERNQ